MKLITPPFSQTQGGVACGINIKTNVDSKQMSTDDNTSYFWQECFTFSEIKNGSVLHAGGVCEAPWVKLATGCYL